MIFDRLYRLILLARCAAAFPLLGKATRVPRHPAVIIVVLSGKLGDIVCGTPVLRALRTHLPRARLVVAGAPVLAPLLQDSGLVDEYLDIESKGGIGRIAALRADAALITGPSFTPAALLYLAGVRLVVAPRVVGGFSPIASTVSYRILRRIIKTFPYQMGVYAPRERLRVLEPLGIFSDDTKKHLGFSETASKKVENFFIDNGSNGKKDFVVGISTSAGNKIKEWPEERFAEVADYVIEKYRAKIVLIGGPGDREKVAKTKSHMKFGTHALEIIDFSIDELKALIAQLHLFIAVDTGPIYIAEAFDVPTIDIVGPMDEKEQPPRGSMHRRVLPPQRERPQLSILNARGFDREEATRQTLSITAEAVIREADKLIRALHESRGN
ncbi:glycosyltransferase family 9 protein [Candidatus Kaiserbacteria bacterium]|nr:glycosyltransferase family 9 protein [Candidatus Kaiserbacteria bacterium]